MFCYCIFILWPNLLKAWCKARVWFHLKLWLKIFLTSLIDCQKIILVTDVLWSVRKAQFGHGCGWGRCCYWWCFQLFTQFVHPRCALDTAEWQLQIPGTFEILFMVEAGKTFLHCLHFSSSAWGTSVLWASESMDQDLMHVLLLWFSKLYSSVLIKYLVYNIEK